MDGDSLTERQLSDLAGRLVDTQRCAYFLCERMFGVTPGGEIFGRLEVVCELTKCIECDFWTEVSDTCDHCGETMQ